MRLLGHEKERATNPKRKEPNDEIPQRSRDHESKRRNYRQSRQEFWSLEGSPMGERSSRTERFQRSRRLACGFQDLPGRGYWLGSGLMTKPLRILTYKGYKIEKCTVRGRTPGLVLRWIVDGIFPSSHHNLAAAKAAINEELAKKKAESCHA